MNKLLISAIIASGVILSGCTTVASAISNATVAFTSSTPSQATTVADAAQIATLAEQAVDLYVKNGNPSPAVLNELKVLLADLHTPLVAAENANKSGNSAAAAAAVTAFNEALAAYQAYAASAGVKS